MGESAGARAASRKWTCTRDLCYFRDVIDVPWLWTLTFWTEYRHSDTPGFSSPGESPHKFWFISAFFVFELEARRGKTDRQTDRRTDRRTDKTRNAKQLVTGTDPGASIPMGQGGHVPQIFGLGGHYHECPSQYFWSIISYFLSMQYFLDKLKEFSEFSQKKKIFNRM